MKRLVRWFERAIAREWRLMIGTTLTTTAVVGAAGTLLLLHAALNKPLAVPSPERLTAIRPIDETGDGTVVPADLRDAIAAVAPGVGPVCSRNAAGLMSIGVGGVRAFQVVELFGPGCLKMFGVNASPDALAAFDRAAADKGQPAVAFVSERFWRTVLGSSPIAVGSTIQANTGTVRIAGILPRTFSGLKRDAEAAVLLPSSYGSAANGRATEFLVSVDPAMRAPLIERLRSRWPAIVAATGDAGLAKTSVEFAAAGAGFSSLGDRFGRALAALEWLALAILAFGALTLGGMFGLSMARRRVEFRIRRALGAGTRQLLITAVAPTLVAITAGGLIAPVVAADGARRLAGEAWVSSVALDLDLTVTLERALALAGVAVGVALLAMAAPAGVAVLTASAALRTDASSSSRSRARQWLLGAEVAACVGFIAGATAFGAALVKLSTTPLGFQLDRLYVARATPQPGGYNGLNEAEYFPATIDALTRLPGIESASMSRYFAVPLVPGLVPVVIPGVEAKAIEDIVSPRFFETVGIRRLAGRDFTWRDTASTPDVAILSESLARALFGRANVIGETLPASLASPRPTEIVGVAADAMYGTVKTPERRVLYRPSLQRPQLLRAPLYHVRAAAGAGGIETAFRDTVTARGREAVAGATLLARTVRQSMLEERLLSWVGSASAALAVLLALCGLQAHLAYSVQAELRESAIRSALGASRRQLGWEYFRRGLAVAAGGALAGVPLFFAIARIARHAMPALGTVSMTPVLIGVGLAVVAGAVGSLAPAIRASRADAAAIMKSAG